MNYLKVLRNDLWKGEACFIVGGGPSLIGFDFSLLKGRKTIAVNRAFEKFNPTIILSMDYTFYRSIKDGAYGEFAKQRFESLKCIKVLVADYPEAVYEDILIIPRIDHSAITFSLNLEKGLADGGNSGFAALNLAWLLGASPIYLLGFDFCFLNGRSHWHDGHPNKIDEKIFRSYVKQFERWASLILKKSEVYNLSPISILTCFPKKSLNEVFS